MQTRRLPHRPLITDPGGCPALLGASVSELQIATYYQKESRQFPASCTPDGPCKTTSSLNPDLDEGTLDEGMLTPRGRQTQQGLQMDDCQEGSCVVPVCVGHQGILSGPSQQPLPLAGGQVLSG
eukprot:536905-Rhodomonas_salina.1